jgi:hypothetical protein
VERGSVECGGEGVGRLPGGFLVFDLFHFVFGGRWLYATGPCRRGGVQNEQNLDFRDGC